MKLRPKVGALALQGDFERHLFRLGLLGVDGYEVRVQNDLEGLDGLIIPGGESTTLSLLIDRFNMRNALLDFCRRKAVWGTCAGMIMLASEVDDEKVRPLRIIDISVARNAYGRQVHSFHSIVDADLNGKKVKLQASFIRAPQVRRVGDAATVLSWYDGAPILVSEGNCLAASFHTELDDDLTLTKYFLENFVSVYK
jgi:5'-phosphate synthase pdxT subunit